MFYAKVSWYDEYEDEVKEQNCIIPTTTYKEAVEAIDQDLPYIESIFIERIGSEDETSKVVYIPSECVTMVISANEP